MSKTPIRFWGTAADNASDARDNLWVTTELNWKANLSWANFTGAVNVAWNVWIWTTSNLEKLYVNWWAIWYWNSIGSFVPTAYSKIQGTSTWWVYPYDSNWNLVLQPRTWWVNQDLVVVVWSWSSSSVNAMVVKGSTGNVWIWTTSPWSKLSVVWLPTSSAWLSSWDIWRDWTTLKIVA